MNEDSMNEEGEKEGKAGLDMQDPLFLVGEIAQSVDLHPQTVRYFDSRGVVVPYKDKNTGRRKYSIYDLYKITLRSQYQNLGFSVAETEEIFKKTKLEEIISGLHVKERELENERLDLELRQAGLQNMLERMERIETCSGRYRYLDKPAMWRHPHMKDGKVLMDTGSVQARKAGMERMPLSVYSFHFDHADIAGGPGPEVCRWDMALPAPYAELTGFHKIPGAYLEPERRCLYTVFEQEGTLLLTWDVISQETKSFLDGNGLVLCGDVEGTIIINTLDEKRRQKRYFEVWLPVEAK
ncbi:MAG: MerR family transcriptional regulator [Bacillota bacterium]|nr:MerR family transcriptional regulator [Bacillota bacterium]